MQKEKPRDVIRRLINESGKRAIDVAREAGVPQSTLSRILTGKIEEPSDRPVAKLAEYFGVSGDQIRGREPIETEGSADKIAQHPALHESNVAPPPKLEGYVPVISWVQAGSWTEVCNVDAVSEEMVPRPPACSDRTFALRVKGQSMAPKYEPDLIIYVDPEVLPFDGDDVVAVLTDSNEATFKQFVEEPGDDKMLKARNPSWPDPYIPINGNCEIVGVVIATMWMRKPRA
ncbi:S24 family peptidase [Halomonas elongata]|nr:S24 family peptidase [Halomonas elongata]WBF19241.1 helix-turn-helix domain-containing protein [Halomonas elongata]WPU48101.1 S24 family peptidase [Halomonas elongata DSM 2581]